MASKQSRISRGRPLMLNTANIDAPPDNGYESPQESTPLQAPHHQMSPLASSLLWTTGIIIGITQPSGAIVPAVAQPGGFELILWVANPSGWFWNRCTSVFLDYRDASVTFDIDAYPLFVEIEPTSVLTPGDIIFTFTEV